MLLPHLRVAGGVRRGTAHMEGAGRHWAGDAGPDAGVAGQEHAVAQSRVVAADRFIERLLAVFEIDLYAIDELDAFVLCLDVFRGELGLLRDERHLSFEWLGREGVDGD